MDQFKRVLLSFLIFITSVLPSHAKNYFSLDNSVFRVDLDRVTAGFSIMTSGEELISSGYPPSSFILLSIDGRNYPLYQKAYIEDIEANEDLLSASLSLDHFTVLQEIRFERSIQFKNSGLLVAYKVMNNDTREHNLAMVLVLDVVPPVEHHSFDKAMLELKLSGLIRPFFFEVPDTSSALLKLGDYQGFKSDFWKNKGRTDKNDNALAVYVKEQTIAANGRFRLSVLLRQSEAEILETGTGINPEDLDFFTEGPVKMIQKRTNAFMTNKSQARPNPVIPMRSIQSQTNQVKPVQPNTNQVKPVKKARNPYDFNLLDDFIDDAAGKTNRSGTGK